MGRRASLALIIIPLLVAIIPVNALQFLEGTDCVFILAPNAWYLRDSNSYNASITISLKYRLENLTLSTSTPSSKWLYMIGYFGNNTSITYLLNGSRLHSEYNYSGNISGLVDSLVEDSSILFSKGIYSENISLELNSTLSYNMLLREPVELWTSTRQRILVVDFRIRASETPLIALGVTVNAGSKDLLYNVTYYADSVHRELFIPVNPRNILLNKSSIIDSLNVTIKAYHEFKGVIDIVLYVIEFPQPVIDLRINNVKTPCKPYVFLSPTIAPKAIAVAVRKYYMEITSPPPNTYNVMGEGDEILYDYTYKVGINLINKTLLNNSKLGFLLYVFNDLFNSTSISLNWTTSIQFKINSIVNGIVNYVLRILQLKAKYDPIPVQGVSKPICGDGILGVCPILWLNKLRGADSTITNALAILPAPGVTAVSSTQWLSLPWATDIAFPGYQATPENLVARPLLFTRVYLGYPFASLTPLPGAVWFTGRGVVENSSYGLYRGVPVVGVDFRGENYSGSFYIDAFYLSPIKAFFEGEPSTWENFGLKYRVYYDLEVFRWRGFWRNLKTTIIPVTIESKNSSTTLLLVLTQPGNSTINVSYMNSTLLLNISANKPLRILVLGKGKPYDDSGAYWLALPLVSELDIVYPTTLLYIAQETAENYNYIQAFPIITVNSTQLKLLLLNGDRWLVKNVSIGEPRTLDEYNIIIRATPTIGSTNTLVTNTTTSIQNTVTPSLTEGNYRLIAGIIVLIVFFAVMLAYNKFKRRR